MLILDWGAVAVFLAATAGGAAHAAWRGLKTWRTFQQARISVGLGVAEVTGGLAGAEARLARAGASADRLDRARRQLQESLATLSLLTAAAGDARGALRVLPFLRR